MMTKPAICYTSPTQLGVGFAGNTKWPNSAVTLWLLRIYSLIPKECRYTPGSGEFTRSDQSYLAGPVPA